MLQPAAPAQAPRLRLLDGLRFLAAFSVVVFHYTATSSPAWGRPATDVFPALSSVSRFGYLGVWLFFLISGFVIMMSAEGKSLRSFALARVTRLYPAYWCGMIITGVLLFLTKFETPAGSWAALGPSGFILNLTMLQQNWGVVGVDRAYWSLWIELVFYGLIVVLFLVRGVSRRGMLALAIAWPVGAQLAQTAGFPALSEFLGPMYAPFFGIGVALYLMHRGGFRLSYVLVFAADLCIGLFEADAIIPNWMRGGTPGVPGGGATALAMLAIVGIVAAVTLTPLQRLDWKWLSVLGALTYPLYVVHEITGWWIISNLRHVLPEWLALLTAIVVVIAVAALIHYGVERRMARWLRVWNERDRALRDGERAPLPPLARRTRSVTATDRPVERPIPALLGRSARRAAIAPAGRSAELPSRHGAIRAESRSAAVVPQPGVAVGTE